MPAPLEPNRFVMVELCAGSARLSASFRDRGCQVFPFDNNCNMRRPCVTVFDLDLTQTDVWLVPMDLFTLEAVNYIHIGPPCGTSRAARNRPVP